MRKYIVHYYKPEPHHYAYHTTHCWIWAKLVLWHLKRMGYNEAYMEDYNDLKLACIKEHGWEFGEKYDKVNQGVPIGNLEQTAEFLDKVEQVKKLYK